MKKAVILSVIIVSVLLIPHVSSASQSPGLKTSDVLILLPGEETSDTISALNLAGLNFTAVVYTGYSTGGLPVGSLNFTPAYTIFKDWKAGEVQEIPFNVSLSPEVSPGIYTLILNFRAMAEDGSIHTLSLEVPVRVSLNPVVLKSVELRVLERPKSGLNPFNGETLLVIAHVKNIGRHPEGVLVSLNLTSLESGAAVFQNSTNLVMPPGPGDVEFRVPFGWDWPSGKYNLSLTVESLRGSEGFWKVIGLSTGIDYMNVSIAHDSVIKGKPLKGYATIISERSIDLNLSVSALKEGSEIWSYKNPLLIKPGTNVFELNLPTNVSGEITLKASISYGRRVLASSTAEYTVLEYPYFEKISASPRGDTLQVNVSIVNPNSLPFDLRLYYNMSGGNAILYSDSESIVVDPGEEEKEFEFKVPRNTTVSYTFLLLGEDGTEFDRRSGSLFVPPAAQPSPSSSPVNTSGEAVEGGGGGNDEKAVLVAGLIFIIAVILAGLFLGSRGEEGYVSPWERARKPRTKPKPKRRSPLGRFKRPKLPKFIENRELPRKFRRRPVAKTRKKKK
ncbi:hypothetical protein A3L09_10375 [Thermococcus profundus]|uniref:Uncharacterized protein n=1 Tax=Thermococcus profundus TaxID=49899 RepID=A0A2Z2MDI8_THEPR|nr:hypothetical protein [Thermococcus profundus]ASJ03633.1 hypothetical protein A3L09_10375 [Thermococcus profundus]